jgi:hypothetical protein
MDPLLAGISDGAKRGFMNLLSYYLMLYCRYVIDSGE